MHKDVEIVSELIDSPRSIIFDQAEKRMHAQKGVIAVFAGQAVIRALLCFHGSFFPFPYFRDVTRTHSPRGRCWHQVHV
ncbi:MAG: hypothetical protein GYA24_13350 [Candidatus Lokiarchaeota archaeon]|nr:hypothetical protein [Candidatus Lokiarchaeota archaeon]